MSGSRVIPPIIPAPFAAQRLDGSALSLRDGDVVSAPAEVSAQVDAMITDLADDGGPRLLAGDAGIVRVELVPELDQAAAVPAASGRSPYGAEPVDERYVLRVSDTGVRINARTPAGAFRGLTALRRLVIAEGRSDDGQWRVPGWAIIDGPRLAWRGLKLDVARFRSLPEEILAIVDELARYGYNALTLHLTDDQAWRPEIEARPELTAHTDDTYSRAELADVVRRARERCIVVIPEIDLPGHSAALLAADPTLGVIDDGGSRPVAYVDPHAERLWPLLRDVYRELLELTASPYLHLGGDEAFRMPDALYAEFIRRAVTLVRELGAIPIAYQEASRAGVGADMLAQIWVDFAGPGGDLERLERMAAAGEALPLGMPASALSFYRLAAGDLARAQAHGAGILLSPTRRAYFDTPYAEPSMDAGQESRRAAGLGLAAYTPQTLEQFYDWDPATVIDGVDAGSLAGVEASLWADTVADAETLQLLLVARLPGFSERAWSPSTGRDWSEFRDRLAGQAPTWRRRGLAFYASSLVDWR